MREKGLPPRTGLGSHASRAVIKSIIKTCYYYYSSSSSNDLARPIDRPKLTMKSILDPIRPREDGVKPSYIIRVRVVHGKRSHLDS